MLSGWELVAALSPLVVTVAILLAGFALESRVKRWRSRRKAEKQLDAKLRASFGVGFGEEVNLSKKTEISLKMAELRREVVKADRYLAEVMQRYEERPHLQDVQKFRNFYRYFMTDLGVLKGVADEKREQYEELLRLLPHIWPDFQEEIEPLPDPPKAPLSLQVRLEEEYRRAVMVDLELINQLSVDHGLGNLSFELIGPDL